jgi:hypothetical protein
MSIFFIFCPRKICISPTGIISSLSPPRCHLSSGRHHHAAAPCHASFPWSQDEVTASTSSSIKALSHRLLSRAETKILNLQHHRRIPSSDSPIPPSTTIKRSSQPWSLSLPNRISILPLPWPEYYTIRAPSVAVIPFHRSRMPIVHPHNDTHGDELADPFSLPKQLVGMWIHIKRYFEIS